MTPRSALRAATCAGLAALILPAAASAQEPCAKANSTIELRECWGAELARADAALNDSYTLLRGLIASAFPGDDAFASETNDRLRDAQRAWITLRDNDCTVAGNAYHGGSLEPVVVTMCLYDATTARTRTLDRIAADYSDS